MSIQKPSHTFTKIHLKALHTQRLNILFALSFTVFINTVCFAQKDLPEKNTEIPSVEDSTETPQEKETDTTVTILPEDFLETPKEIDSTKNDSIQPKTQLLSSTVTYKATDYMAYKKKESKMYLYNEAEVYYEDMEIKAGSIILDFDKDYR